MAAPRPAIPLGRRAARPLTIRLALALLLASYAAMTLSGAWANGISFDEGQQLAIGWNIWTRGDYRIEGGNGDFVKRWATLPFLISQPNFLHRDDPVWHRGDPYEIAHRFFFASGNRPESLLRQGRAMMVLLGVVAGLLVFQCSREIFGAGGALLSTALFALSPHMLAFGGIVSTDLPISLALLASTWCVWRLLHEITIFRVLGSLAVFGLLVLAKPSALAILPITAGLLAVKLVRAKPLAVIFGGAIWIVGSRRAQGGVFALLIVLHAAAAWAAIWGHYGFRYAASPDPADARLVMPRPALTGEEPAAIVAILDWTRETRFCPEGFRRGIRSLLAGVEHLRSFMNGEWTAGGRWDFFPYAIWAKTRPAVALLIVLGAGAWCSARRRVRAPVVAPEIVSPTVNPPSLYAATPYLVLIAVYFAIAVAEDVNLGHRHVLPIYPALYVLAGAAVVAWGARSRWSRIAILALVGWATGEAWSVRPHYLSYFGPQVGGPDEGYQHLVDSSLDWGMSLPGLTRWLDQNDLERRERLYLAYFGTDNPDYYGIACQKLPGFFDWREVKPYPLQPGLYAISATLLQGVYTAAFGPWTGDYETIYQTARANLRIYDGSAGNFALRAKLIHEAPPGYWDALFRNYDHLRFARLCAWLRQQEEPPHHVDHALFIWKLDQAALDAALDGPPPELKAGYVIAGRDN